MYAFVKFNNHAYVKCAACLYEIKPMQYIPVTVIGSKICLKTEIRSARARFMNKQEIKY